MKTQTARLTKPKILRVWIEKRPDESPDTSHLGEYQRHIPNGYYIDRETGNLHYDADTVVAEVWTNYGRNEYQYISGFQHSASSAAKEWAHVDTKGVNQAYLNCRYRMNRAHENKKGNLFAKYKVDGWETAVTREQKIRVLNIVYCCEDAYRLETLQRGDWCYLGIIAKAEIQVKGDVVQVIHSGGLWGVESDSGNYLEEVAKEQLEELGEQLEAMGIGERAIKHEFKNVKTQ
jgi:hypothetical protein